MTYLNLLATVVLAVGLLFAVLGNVPASALCLAALCALKVAEDAI